MQLSFLRIILFTTLITSAGGLLRAVEPVQFEYAANVRVNSFPTHRIVEVQNINRNSQDVYRYALVPKGQPVPDLPEAVAVIRTPVERIVVMSTTFVGYLDALGRVDAIAGAATPNFINNPEVHTRIEAGEIQTVQTGQSLDMESMLLLQPDLILTSSSGNPRFDIHPQLARSGLPIVISASYMEAHPLARAEWIKVIAAFLEMDAQADQVFTGIAERYEALCRKTDDVSQRPSVFTSAPYSGAWYVAGGASYTAQAIKDAGGDYLWAEDDSAGGIALDFERVFIKAAQADIWINPSSYQSLSALFNADQRFQKFKAAREGHIFNNSKQQIPGGGNNIWERGIVHPDEVLADLIQIFHPGLLEDRELVFYEQLK